MAYCKKVAVLKQYAQGFSSVKTLSGIIRIETESEVGTIFISIINIAHASNGEYVCFVSDSNASLHKFHLGKRPSSLTQTFSVCPSVENGFSAGVFYIENDLPLLVGFCKTEDYQKSMQDLKKLVGERCFHEYKVFNEKTATEQKKDECFMPSSTPTTNPTFTTSPSQAPASTSTSTQLQQDYNDEAVATENYYTLEDSINDKISILENWQNETLQNENGGTFFRSQTQKEQDQKHANCLEDEANASIGKEYSKNNPYYNKVAQELQTLFDKFEDEKALLSVFPNGKWVKIYYNQEKYYVVGVITENNKPKYICYGVPHPYSEQPPKELAGVSTFIPISIFNLHGDGYFMMFQDAVTGKCVKLN